MLTKNIEAANYTSSPRSRLESPMAHMYDSPVAHFGSMERGSSVAVAHFGPIPRGSSVPMAQESSVSTALIDLIDAQKPCGSFALEGRLGLKLSSRFSNRVFSEMTEHLKTNLSPLPPTQSCENQLLTIRNTVLVIVFIRGDYADSAELWELVVRKASEWVRQQVPDESVRSTLYTIAQSCLRNSSTSPSDEKADDSKDSKKEGGDAPSSSQHTPISASSDNNANERSRTKQQGDAHIIDDQGQLELTGKKQRRTKKRLREVSQ
jgi:hypothetical protein